MLSQATKKVLFVNKFSVLIIKKPISKQYFPHQTSNNTIQIIKYLLLDWV